MSKKIEIPRAYNEFFKKLRDPDIRAFNITGGRGSAKSWQVGIAECILASEGAYTFVNCREVQNSIKDSVHRQLAMTINDYDLPNFEVNDRYIRNIKTGSLFIFEGLYRNIESIKSIPKIDFCWIEEAQTISDESIRIIMPTVRGEKKKLTDLDKKIMKSKLFFTWNPRDEADPIYQYTMVKKRADFYYLHTTFRDNSFCPEVIKQEARELKLSNYDDYLNVYEGELRKIGDDILISTAEVYACFDRIIRAEGRIELGVDCARFGNDSSSIAKRKGMSLQSIKTYDKKRTTELARYVMEEAEGDKNVPIKVDVGGLGAGVVDTLHDEGYNVIEVNFGESAKNPDRYVNAISEMWHEFKKSMGETRLINSERLKKELTTRKYNVDKKGRFMIESKSDYKKRGYPSPDVADSTLLCFYEATPKLCVAFV